MIKDAIKKVVEGIDLEEDEARECMSEIMNGDCTPAQIACFLTALRIKGETVSEITGSARVMRERATKIKAGGDVVDTCGTGGDGAHTFNISTISSLVVAGAGIRVAKHGNRSVSSRCGSADLLLGLGVKLDVSPSVVERCIEEIGFGFLFAPLLHGAMKYAIGPRREMGIRTIFNILGPLTNPAGAKNQLLGVYDASLTETLAEVLKRLGSDHVFVVHGEDGLDEVSLTQRTKVTELRQGNIRTYWVSPEDFGFQRTTLDELQGGDVKENVEICLGILRNNPSPKMDAVLLNAAFAIVASGAAPDIKEGIELARSSIQSGRAIKKLEDLISLTNQE
jgi:anthranilate phosphoribosyltransferase